MVRLVRSRLRKRVRQAPVPTYRKYIPRGQNTYSAFQKSSGIERKNIDDSSAKWASTSAGWSINCLNDVAQGTTAITRIGRKILMKSVLVQGLLATNTGNSARVLIVYDRQPNGALPAATDVLTSNTIMAAQNLDNRDRFLILADIMPYDQVENISTLLPILDLVTRDTSSAILKLFIRKCWNHCRHHVWFPHHDDKLQCWNTYW